MKLLDDVLLVAMTTIRVGLVLVMFLASMPIWVDFDMPA